MISRRQAAADGHTVARFNSHEHVARGESALSLRHHHPLAISTADHRAPGHIDDGPDGLALDAHPGEHVRTQCEIRVVQAKPNPQGPALRVQFRIDVVHGRCPYLAGALVQGYRGRLAWCDPVCLALEHFGDDPDRVQSGHGQHLRGRCHEIALTNTQVGDHAVDFGHERHALVDRAFPVQALNCRHIHSECGESFPGGPQERFVTP